MNLLYQSVSTCLEIFVSYNYDGDNDVHSHLHFHSVNLIKYTSEHVRGFHQISRHFSRCNQSLNGVFFKSILILSHDYIDEYHRVFISIYKKT